MKPGITAFDAVGPMDAFATARIEDNGGRPRSCYKLITIGVTSEEVVAESGLILRPMTTLAQCPRLDTLLIPADRVCVMPERMPQSVHRVNRSLQTLVFKRLIFGCAAAAVCVALVLVLPKVPACQAMENLLAVKHNVFWHESEVIVAAQRIGGY